jgi:hypothetical protein
MYTLYPLAHTLVFMYLARTDLCTVPLYTCPEYHNMAPNTRNLVPNYSTKQTILLLRVSYSQRLTAAATKIQLAIISIAN